LRPACGVGALFAAPSRNRVAACSDGLTGWDDMTVWDALIRHKDRSVVGVLRGFLRSNELSRTAIAGAQMAVDSLVVPISSFLSLGFTVFALRHDGIHFHIYVLPTAAATIVLVFNLARSGVYNTFNAQPIGGSEIRY